MGSGTIRPPNTTKSTEKEVNHSIFSISNRLKIGVILLATVSVGLTGLILIYQAFSTQREQVQTIQQDRSRSVAREINSYMDDLQRKLSYLSRVNGLTDMAPHVQTQLLEGLSRHNNAYRWVALLDNKGRIVSSFTPNGESPAEISASSPEFELPLKQENYYIGPVRLGTVADPPTLILSVPVRNRQDQVSGVLITQIDLRFLEFATSSVSVGETGYTYVLDERNRIISNQRQVAETFELDIFLQSPIFARSQFGIRSQPVDSYRGITGDQVIGAISTVGETGWSAVVELPTNEANAPILKMVWLMSLSAAVLIAVAAVIAWVLSKQIVTPLRKLTDAAGEFASGAGDVQVDVTGRHELGILARAFNHMSRQIRENRVRLEQLVEDRTHDLTMANQKLSQEITERNEAELQVRASLVEKEVMLQEINHRVKNNLQIISSLLSMQSRDIQDEQSLRSFQVSQDRIQAMALVHDKLYRSDDLARIDIGDYIRSLAEDLRRSYGLGSQDINLIIDVDNVLLGVDTAIPCGVIVNELVSNSLKHAFPDRGSGEIVISFREADGQYTMIFKDDGVGLPEDLDVRRPSSLGMTIVNALTGQLNGAIDLVRNGGTEISIRFPAEQSKGD